MINILVNINKEEYIFSKNIVKDNNQRESFFLLAYETFGINFKKWHRAGYWTDNYITYTLIKDNDIVANISIHKMKFLFENSLIELIQIGTVMTRYKYRKKGLTNYLMDRVLSDYSNSKIYLFANNSVLDFYPKYGFKELELYDYYIDLYNLKNNYSYRSLNMKNEKDIKILLEKFKRSNPYSRFKMIENKELLMFYCMDYLKDSIYYIEELELVFIIENSEEEILIYDIYGEEVDISILDLLSSLDILKDRRIKLGFMPKDIKNIDIEENLDSDLILFSKEDKIIKEEKLIFPFISHG